MKAEMKLREQLRQARSKLAVERKRTSSLRLAVSAGNDKMEHHARIVSEWNEAQQALRRALPHVPTDQTSLVPLALIAEKAITKAHSAPRPT